MKKNKTWFNLFLLLFVGFTVYSSQGDLKLLYKKGNDFLQQKIAGITNGNFSIPDFIEKEKETSTHKETITPGPLVAKEDENGQEISDTSSILSSAGILSYTNEERAKAGLKPLTLNSTLTKTASYKTNDMFVYQYFEHVAPNGEAVGDVATKFGYQYIIVGENLALGNFSSNKKLVDAWMESPGHRENILNPNYSEIGIGVQKSMYKGEIVWMAVQHFGTPNSSCPQVDLKNKVQIQAGEQELKIMSETLKAEKEAIEGMELTNPTYRDRVDGYNEMVASYNELVVEVKEMIKKYNSEVVLFNDCIKDLTS